METEASASYATVNAQTLTPLVCSLLADHNAKLVSWSVKELPCFAVNPVTTGIYRCSGYANCAGTSRQWSLILKALHRPDVDVNGKGYLDAPEDWNYWQREGLAYQSGLLRSAHGGLAAPQCYGVNAPLPSSVWIWLEDLGAESTQRWTIERHILAAQHFGEFNAAHVGRAPTQEDARWLSTQHLRKWIATLNRWGMNQTAHDAAFWSTQFAQTAFAHGSDARLRHLLRQADALSDLLARQAQTLSHQDSHKANLFATKSAQGALQTTAIDWSFLGLAAIGEDLGTQLGGNLFHLLVGANEAKDYCHAATEAYLDALRQSGWRGNTDSVRFASAAAACLRYTPFGVMWLQGCLQANTRGEISGLDNLAQVNGLSTEQALHRWGEAMSFLFDLGDEAMRLAGRI